MPAIDSPLDQVLDTVRAALHARRARLTERVQRVSEALATYQRAVESQLARAYAAEHGLVQPAPPSIAPERALELLEAAVQALRERARSVEANGSSPPPEAKKLAEAPPTAPAPEPPVRFPRLANAVSGGKLVVIGALAGRDRSHGLPREIAEQVEWIDTERDGAHAVGNLPQRLRQGRVAAVVILDRAVKHRHTEPVVAAARESEVPVAFAGQGGQASLLRAFEHLEGTLSDRA